LKKSGTNGLSEEPDDENEDPVHPDFIGRPKNFANAIILASRPGNALTLTS
jgi:hypothetical protein